MLIAIFSLGATSANAAVPYAYEPMTGSDGAVMSANPGSLASNGFTGNWIRVQATKKPNDAASISTLYKSGLTFAYPTNSKYLVPSSNTAAASDWSAWDLTYAARQLSSPISFDSAGTHYMSFLMNVAGNSSSHGSAMTGLIETLTTSSADASP